MKFKLNRSISVRDLVNVTSARPNFQGNLTIERISSLDDMDESSLSFCSGPKAPPVTGIVVSADPRSKNNILHSLNPRLEFIKILQWITNEIGFHESSVSSKVSPGAKIAGSAVVEEGVKIGAGTIVEPGAIIRHGTIIGMNCWVGSNVVIGDIGFGFERNEEGVPLRFPHLGGVIIGNNVEIGPQCSVARGTLGNTILEDDTKLDCFVIVAHNARIEKKVMLASHVSIAGSCHVKEAAWISTGAQIRNGLTIGKDSFVGIGSIVVRNVKDNVKVFGNPAQPIE